MAPIYIYTYLPGARCVSIYIYIRFGHCALDCAPLLGRFFHWICQPNDHDPHNNTQKNSPGTLDGGRHRRAGVNVSLKPAIHRPYIYRRRGHNLFHQLAAGLITQHCPKALSTPHLATFATRADTIAHHQTHFVRLYIHSPRSAPARIPLSKTYGKNMIIFYS